MSPSMRRKSSTETAPKYENLPATIPYQKQKRAPKLPCYLLASHTRNPEFFGQSNIMLQLDKALLPPSEHDDSRDAGLRSFAICGVGGLGKTQIALEYAFSRKSKFDAIFFVQAHGSSNIAESFSRILTKLQLSGRSVIESQTISRRLVMHGQNQLFFPFFFFFFFFATFESSFQTTSKYCLFVVINSRSIPEAPLGASKKNPRNFPLLPLLPPSYPPEQSRNTQDKVSPIQKIPRSRLALDQQTSTYT